ncbi:RNA-directed DNA polymerase from mobile element jockey [Smittium culicis]|uniref:RNA-directed DNA polymerase from mobile element jockey n=1 Tax=Smittium culicis TaxID=133412 RepID=A0A1R1YTK5_9FUNG|nr:RNA-directed DNA polymerase from mobile element jockey [Smittium culicis]
MQIIFDLYTNDISKSFRDVRVPGLTSRIPRLLIADDNVLLVESSADLEAALNAITEWSETWEMAVNASKCGILTIGSENTTDIALQGQKFNPVNQYAYMGYTMNSKWVIFGPIRNNKNKLKKAVYAAYSFLRRSSVLTAIKLKFINLVRISIEFYGGKTFGMSEAIF